MNSKSFWILSQSKKYLKFVTVKKSKNKFESVEFRKDDNTIHIRGGDNRKLEALDSLFPSHVKLDGLSLEWIHEVVDGEILLQSEHFLDEFFSVLRKKRMGFSPEQEKMISAYYDNKSGEYRSCLLYTSPSPRDRS